MQVRNNVLHIVVRRGVRLHRIDVPIFTAQALIIQESIDSDGDLWLYFAIATKEGDRIQLGNNGRIMNTSSLNALISDFVAQTGLKVEKERKS